MATLHAPFELGIIRTFIWWEQVERREGQFEFAMHDVLFRAAAELGIRVMATFGLYLPVWLKRSLAARGIDDSDRRYACFDRPEVAEPLRGYVERVVDRIPARAVARAHDG